jgi:hypothetical protein
VYKPPFAKGAGADVWGPHCLAASNPDQRCQLSLGNTDERPPGNAGCWAVGATAESIPPPPRRLRLLFLLFLRLFLLCLFLRLLGIPTNNGVFFDSGVIRYKQYLSVIHRMDNKRWVPVPYYHNSPLAKLKESGNLKTHKLGYIPKYLKDAKANDTKNNAYKT